MDAPPMETRLCNKADKLNLRWTALNPLCSHHPFQLDWELGGLTAA
jgi:hypothetical protein